MEISSKITAATTKNKIPATLPFEEYCYTKEIIAGRIKGELSIRRTEIKTKEMLIDALGIFFKPVASTTEISLGLAAAPIRRTPNFEGKDRLRKIKLFFKILYTIQILINIDKRLKRSFRKGIPICHASCAIPHIKHLFISINNITYFETGYTDCTLGQFIEELSEIEEEEIPLPQKRLLLLSVLRNIFTMLDNFPRKSHGDFHPLNVLVSLQHQVPEVNPGQPIYIPSEIQTHAIDIGNIRYYLTQNLKKGRLSYTKLDDLQIFFSYLQRWSPQLHKLLGITQLTRERVMQMLAQLDKVAQRTSFSNIIQSYQLRRLNYLLNKATTTQIKYTKEELLILFDAIRKIYEIDAEGEGAPTVVMPYT